LPEHFYARQHPVPVTSPRLLAVNEALGAELGLSGSELHSSELLEVFAGNRVPPGAEPLALAYAGHQFGGFVPRLGDGRAILLGEAVASNGRRYDVQLKGSGRTPFSRGGDGRAALGPVLREFLVSEAMFALGVPTTRSLAAVLSGDVVQRERPLPGAVLTRVASSHLRVGTFQYFAARRDTEALASLVAFALAKHYPEKAGAEVPALALFEAVVAAQATLVAKWVALGFVHGVMNTDNCAISGETLDYGPCAFLDTYDPERTFSSIDEYGRYAFDQQHLIAGWNLARLAETLIPLVADGSKGAVGLLEAQLEQYPTLFDAAYDREMRRKLGLTEAQAGDTELVHGLLNLMAKQRVDFTLTFRSLAYTTAKGEAGFIAQFSDPDPARQWLVHWQERAKREGSSANQREQVMLQANPLFIPRNHRVEEAIAAATAGNLQPFERLRTVLQRPFDEQPEEQELATPPGDEQWGYRTFCGT
jgi:serine/tyrosine/threonine adenylyltransferase